LTGERLVITKDELGSGGERTPAPRRRFRRRYRIAGIAGLLLVVLAVASELLLPSLAESRLRDKLAQNASNVRVHVEAEPAIKLLFGMADRVDVRIGELRSGRGSLGDRLAGTKRTDRLDVTVGALVTHGLRIDRVSLHKRGNVLTAGGTVTRASVQAVLPSAVRLDEHGAGANTLAFTATIRALGRVVRASALVSANGGRLVLQPQVPLGGLVHLTLFDDPRVSIDSVSSARTASGTYVFAARGHLN
jgi:hypothetical protein